MHGLDDPFDIGAPAPFARSLDEGILAMLGERPHAARGRLPEDLAPKPKAAPTPTTKPAERKKTPPPSPSPTKSTPTRSTDQAREGARNNSSTPRPEPVTARPTPKKSTPKKTTPKRRTTPSPEPRPEPTPERTSRTRRSDNDTPSPASDRPDRTAARTTGTRNKDDKPTTPVGSADALERRAAAERRTPTDTADRPSGTTSSEDRRNALKGPRSNPSTTPGGDRPTEPIQGDTNNDGQLSTDEEMRIIRQNASEARNRQIREEREKKQADNLDRALTPEQRRQALEDQAELEEEERRIRERNKPTPTADLPRNRAVREEIAQSNSNRNAQRDTEVTEARREYLQSHDYWVDADGTVYAASLGSNGEIVLEREDEEPAQGDRPATRSTRTARINTDRSRTDEAVTESVPTGAEGEVRQRRTETVNTNPDGRVRDSQIKLEQERDNPDGSRTRSLTQEDYNGEGRATQRVQEQETTRANGDSTLDRTTTSFRPDGTTPDHTENISEQRSGSSEQVTSRRTTTYYQPDGVTPRNQSVVEGGTTADGERVPQTTALNEFDDQGRPSTTFIRREQPERPLSATEYVVWDEDGEVETQLAGGKHISEHEYERFLEDGTEPDTRDVPEEPREPQLSDFTNHSGSSYGYAGGYNMYGGTNDAGQTYAEAIEAYERAHSDWEDERDEVEAYNRASQISELDPDEVRGGEDPVRWVRGSDNRFDGENLDVNLAPPLEPSRETPSVFEVPAAIRSRANAEAIDQSRPARDPAAFRELDQEQARFEERLAGASSDAQREELMREYFADHDYWIDRGSGEGAEPVLMAAAFSDGVPSSSMFGSERAADPHATMARTGIEGQDAAGLPATIDVVQNLYTDGSRDAITRTTHEGTAGAERTSVVGEHTNAAGVLTERDSHVESRVPRTAQGLPPLAQTEVSRERFNERTGKPQGEQYYAVATSDSQQTSLQEQRDYYNADGVIFDTKIETTEMSRNYDAELTDDYLEANAAVIEAARDDDFNPNEDGTQITVPPAGSFYSHSETDIDYDANGVAVYQEVTEESTVVQDAGDENHNGVKVITTDTTRTTGERGGSAPIFDENGERAVDEDVRTTITTNEYDPDAGTAGGNRSTGHQFREITTITLGSTVTPEGETKGHWATPLTTKTLREGFDDDWIFDEKYLRTNDKGQLLNEDGDVITAEMEGDDAKPDELGEGDEVYGADGRRITLENDSIHHEDLDFADKFEEFMEGWGGKILGGVAVVAGIAGAIFTGGASLGLTAVGVGLLATTTVIAGTQFAYTAINHSQGEASGWDLALAGAGVALSVVPVVGGVRSLASGARAATIARAGAGAIDDVVRGASDDLLRSTRPTNPLSTGSRAVDNSANAAGLGLDGVDAYDATRAALQGDFYGAGLMLLAVGGGTVASRVHRPGAHTPDTPDTSGAPDGAGGTNPGVRPDGTPRDQVTGGGPGATPDTPSVTEGAPPVRPTDRSANGDRGTQQDLPGTSTPVGGGGRRAAQPETTPAGPDSTVGGARGDGVTEGTVARQGTPTDAPEVVDALRQSGQLDHAIGDVLRVGTTPEGRHFYIDQGVPRVDANTPARRLEHVIEEHGAKFHERGVTNEQLPDYLATALTTGRPIGITGRDRVVYEFTWNGEVHRAAITVSDRGFVVGANPISLDRQPGWVPNVPKRLRLSPIPEGHEVYTRYQQVMAETRAVDAPEAVSADAAARDFGHATTRRNGPPLEPPLPRDREVVGGLGLRSDAALAANPALLQGTVSLPGDNLGGWRVQGRDQSGRVALQRTINRNTPVESLIALNPDVVARLGGPDAVRANPSLLNGLGLTLQRSDGTIEAGWRAETASNGSVRMSRTESRSMDIGELIVRRQQADPSFDGRAALHGVLASDPTLLQGRPLRLRRSDRSIAEGRAAHNIDDGWFVVGVGRNPDGSPSLTLAKQFPFENLPPAAQAQAAQAGFRPGSLVPLQRQGISINEVLDFNRARLEGDHGQLPRLDVRYRTPDGARIGYDRNLLDGPATRQADQAVVHTQAALDYLYSRYGYTPSGGDIRLVIDADGAHNNASMQSQGNVLRIGTNDGNAAAFDPSVIMHELGHKMVDDYTRGDYGNTEAGSIHEGIGDVMAAAWTHDPIIGRVFGTDGQVIRDLHTGANLITTRQQWSDQFARSLNGPADAMRGVEPHTGSGVVTGFATRLVGAGTQPGDLSWSQVGDLFHDALRTGSMRQRMDFDSLSDGLRIAAAQRYGINSPQFHRVVQSLDQAGLTPRLSQQMPVSRITSRNTVESGWTIAGFNQHGYAILAAADGRTIVQHPAQLLPAGGRNAQVDAAGNVVPQMPRTIGEGHVHGAERSAVAGASGAPAARGPLDPLPDSSRPTVIHDGQSAVASMTSLIASARQRITGDIFVLQGQIAGALRNAATHGRQVNLLLDPERGPGHRQVLDGTDANLVDYGRFDPNGTGEHAKVHSKVLVVDGERAIVTTGAFMDGSMGRRELSFAFQGQAARDLEAWTIASMRNDHAAMQAAARQLQQHDIYVNDPLNGATKRRDQRPLQRRVLDMVSRAEHTISIATKSADERAAVMKQISRIQAERQAAGQQPLTVNLLDQNHGGSLAGVHGTLVIVDGREAYAGTAFIERKAMDGKKNGTGRQSREIGIVTADPATVAQIQRAFDGWNQIAWQQYHQMQAPPMGNFGAVAQQQPVPAQQQPRGLRRLFGR